MFVLKVLVAPSPNKDGANSLVVSPIASFPVLLILRSLSTENMHTRSGFSGEDSQPKNSVSPVQGMSGLHMSPLTSNSNTIHLHNHDKNAMSPHDIMISSGPLQWPGISKGPIAQSYTTTNSNNNAERSWSRIHNADGFFPGY